MDTTNEQWVLIAPIIALPAKEEHPAVLERVTALFSTASSGFFAPELPGKICRRDTRLIKPAIEDSQNGLKKEYSLKFWLFSPKTWNKEERSSLRNVSLTALSQVQKKGLICGKNQARQGNQDYGNR